MKLRTLNPWFFVLVGLSPLLSRGDEAHDAFKAGRSAQLNNDFKLALSQFQRSADIMSGTTAGVSTNLWFEIGRCEQLLGQHRRAITAFRKAIDTKTPNFEHLIWRAYLGIERSLWATGQASEVFGDSVIEGARAAISTGMPAVLTLRGIGEITLIAGKSPGDAIEPFRIVAGKSAEIARDGAWKSVTIGDLATSAAVYCHAAATVNSLPFVRIEIRADTDERVLQGVILALVFQSNAWAEPRGPLTKFYVKIHDPKELPIRFAPIEVPDPDPGNTAPSEISEAQPSGAQQPTTVPESNPKGSQRQGQVNELSPGSGC